MNSFSHSVAAGGYWLRHTEGRGCCILTLPLTNDVICLHVYGYIRLQVHLHFNSVLVANYLVFSASGTFFFFFLFPVFIQA